MRNRSSAIIGMFAAVALGVAIAATALLAWAASAPRVPDRLARADLVLQSPDAADGNDAYVEHVPWRAAQVDALAVRLARIDGVARAVPDRSFYAQAVVRGRPVDGPRIGGTDPRGYAWASHALSNFRLVAGRAPASGDEVVVSGSTGVRPGSRMNVLTASGPRDVRVSGVTSGKGVFFTDRAAAGESQGVRAIALRLAPGADLAAVARAASAHGSVVTGAGRSALEPPEVGVIRFVAVHLLTAGGGLATFSSIFVVASTFTLATGQRRREFALLRAVGATPGQVRRRVLREAATIGAAASATGCLLAVVLSPFFGDMLHSFGMLPLGVTLGVEALPLATAFGLGLVTAVLGAWSAARRASRVPPLEAFREAVVDTRPMTRSRWLAGIGLTVIGLAEAAATPFLETSLQLITPLLAAMALISGLALLSPVIIRPLLRLLPGFLVREHAITALRRTASLVAPIMITIGFVTVITGMTATMAGPADAPRGPKALGAQTVVTQEGTPGLSDAVVEAVSREAEWSAPVSNTVVYRRAPAWMAEPASAMDPSAVKRARRHITIHSGSLDGFGAANSMIITEPAARANGWRPGTVVPTTFADGRTVPITVVAVADPEVLPSRLLITRELLRAHDPGALTDTIYTAGSPDALQGRLAGLGATARSAANFVDTDYAEEQRQIWIVIITLIALSIGYTAVSIVSTLAMATAARFRDLMVLRRAGATNGQVTRMLGLETAVVTAIGTLFGLAIAVPAMYGVHRAMEEGNDRTVPLVIPWPVVGGTVAVCLVLALAAAVLPATRRSPENAG